MKLTGKFTGCCLAVLGLLASNSMPATAAVSLTSYGSSETAVLHDGVTAGLRFTVPLGGDRATTPEPRLALGLDFYKSFQPGGDPFSPVTRRASLASLDFTHQGFQRLSIANQTALTTTHDPINGTRLGFFAPKPSTLLWGAIIVGAAVGVYFLADSGSDSETDPEAQ